MKVHYNNKNQLVARTHDDGVLRKRVKSEKKHMRHKPPSWGFDVDIIKDTNAKEIRILAEDTNTVYKTSMDTFVEHGFTQDIGAGEQTFLALEHWDTYEKTEKPIAINVNTLWEKKVGVRDRYIEQAKKEKRGLEITHKKEKMTLPFGGIKEKIAFKSPEPFKDKFSGDSHHLYYFKWTPDEEPHDFQADIDWFNSLPR